MLTVAEHANMLSAQYLASALRESHPIHHIVTSPSGPRSLKQTLQSAFHNDVAPYLENGIVPRGHYSDVKNKIHADFVRRAISTRQTNTVLNQPAPPIHVSESRLPPSSSLCHGPAALRPLLSPQRVPSQGWSRGFARLSSMRCGRPDSIPSLSMRPPTNSP